MRSSAPIAARSFQAKVHPFARDAGVIDVGPSGAAGGTEVWIISMEKRSIRERKTVAAGGVERMRSEWGET